MPRKRRACRPDHLQLLLGAQHGVLPERARDDQPVDACVHEGGDVPLEALHVQAPSG